MWARVCVCVCASKLTEAEDYVRDGSSTTAYFTSGARRLLRFFFFKRFENYVLHGNCRILFELEFQFFFVKRIFFLIVWTLWWIFTVNRATKCQYSFEEYEYNEEKKERNGIDSFQSADYNWWKTDDEYIYPKTWQIRSKCQLPVLRCCSCKFCIHNAIWTNDGVDLIHKYDSFTMLFYLVLSRKIRFTLRFYVCFIWTFCFQCDFALFAGRKKSYWFCSYRDGLSVICIHRGTTNSIVEHFIGCLTLSQFERTSTLHLSVLYIDWNCYCCCCCFCYGCCCWCCWKVIMFSISIWGIRQLVRHIDAIGLKWPLAWCHVENLSVFNGNESVQMAYASDVVIAFDCWATYARMRMQQSTKFSNRNGSNSYRSHVSLASWAYRTMKLKP